MKKQLSISMYLVALCTIVLINLNSCVDDPIIPNDPTYSGVDSLPYDSTGINDSTIVGDPDPSDTIINDSCIDWRLMDSTISCEQIYKPVCGCDGVTYYNSCEAIYRGGVTSYVEGECE